MRLLGVALAIATLGLAAAALREARRAQPVVPAPVVEAEAQPEVPLPASAPRARGPLPFGGVPGVAASTTTAGVSGTIVDDEGRPVPRYLIRLHRRDSYSSTVTVSDEHGQFSIDVEPGDYDLYAGVAWSLPPAPVPISLERGERLIGFQVDVRAGALPQPPPVPPQLVDIESDAIPDAQDRCPDNPLDGDEDDGCPDRAPPAKVATLSISRPQRSSIIY